MNQGIRTYYEMIAAIIFQAVIYCIAGALLSGQYVMFPLGVIVGSFVAAGLLRSMLQSIDISLDLDPDTAKRFGRKRALIRFFLMALTLLLAFYFEEYVNPWGVFLGVLSLKFSAYLQPLVHKYVTTKYLKRRQKSK